MSQTLCLPSQVNWRTTSSTPTTSSWRKPKKYYLKKNLREKKVVGKEKDRKKDVRDTDTQIESLREGEEKEWANNI